MRRLTLLLLTTLALPATAHAGVFQDRGALGAAARDVVLGPDGNLWATEPSAGKVARVTPGGAVLAEYDVGSGPAGVSTGPNGTVWVAVRGATKLVWFDATGAAPTAHDVSTAAISACGPVGVADGGDGRMYVSAPNDGACAANRLGSVVAATGSGAAFTPVTGRVYDLTVASGKLFAADYDNDAVRRFGLGAALTPEAVVNLDTGAAASSLTPDNVGNIWVAESGPGRVATFPVAAATGTTATVYAPSGGTLTNPTGIAAQDGAVFVTGTGSADVARVSASGAYTFFPLAGAQPAGIAAGPDGELRIADAAAPRLVRLVDTAPRATTGAATVSASDDTQPTATATIAGTVDPRGNEPQVVVDYGPTTAYGTTTPPITVPAGVDPAAVSFTLGGLAHNTTYHARVRATNARGAADGADVTVVTRPQLIVDVFPPQSVFRGVTLKGGRYRLDVKGRVLLPVTCPASARTGCTGTLKLTAKVRRRVAGRLKTVTVTVATGRLSILAGKSAQVRVTVAAAKRRLVPAKGLKVTLTASTHDAGAATNRATTATITLLRPLRRG